MNHFRIGITLAISLCSSVLMGQLDPRAEYIKTYSSIAVEEMNRSGIPASITLAQGILESGSGKSELASKANNHFGIKCHSDWKGARVLYSDDKRNECFRSYDDVKHSFEDHTDFLTRSSRYMALFDLEPSDYKGWAEGLQTAGYATSADYSKRLIKIIEDEKLFLLDQGKMDSLWTVANVQVGPVLNSKGKVVKNKRQKFLIRRTLVEKNLPPYVELLPGETLENIADSLKLPVSILLDFNDLQWYSEVSTGDRIYLEAKRKWGREKMTTLESNESIHELSQREGVAIAKIYKYNNYLIGYHPIAGEEVRLRRKWFFEGWYSRLRKK